MRADLALLRLHVEAVWHLTLPDIHNGDNTLPETVQPTWALYLARLTDGQQVRLWRADVAETARKHLLARAEAALALSPDDSIVDERISREVALVRREPPRLDSQAASLIARRLTGDDRELLSRLTQYVDYYLGEECAPVFIVVEDGRIVCMAHSSRRREHACELGIDTLLDARRRGYALAATVLWAEAVAAEGREPFYSALAENSASLALAHAAGYRPFAHGVSVES
ncbi:MAG TPA: GNAT family N-acetyltransferase [Ktedonobacterales bacterium]